MNTEVTAMILEEVDEQADGRTEGELMDLGEVSKDTHGGWIGGYDYGIGLSIGG